MDEFQKKIGFKFTKLLLLKEALTHRSYLNENPEWPTPHNERLEFLGDAVLELITTEFLFYKYPDYPEGKLTSVRAALVNHVMLSKVSSGLSLDNYIFLSRGEAKGIRKAREVIMANAVEAVIGAIYLDGGYDAARKFVEEFILINLDSVMEGELYRDPKSLLQEVIQEKMKITPTYEVLNESGPDHQKEFVVGVFSGKDLMAEGKGTSKQEAECVAAEEALKNLA